MALKEFKNKIREYRRLTGVSQEILADRLGLNPAVLSTKLNNTDGATLNYQEVKGIIKALAHWQAIYTREQALELLGFLSLKESLFSPEEWQRPPLDRLEVEREIPVSSPVHLSPVSSKDASDTGQALPIGRPLSIPPLEVIYPLKPRHNLPAQPHPLVGREHEIELVRGLLERADVRLLTLVGPGGTGKTRLSLQVAASLVDDYEDGVFQVQLARLNEPGLVAQSIAQTLEIQEVAQSSIKQNLKQYLHNKRMLLILDNFEQLLVASDLVAELLAAAPQLKILITSRTILKLYGEYEFRVPPLVLPNLKELPLPGPELVSALSHNEAVALFIQRARAVKSGFALTPENGREVAEICRLLDGLPLALELAAARLKLFSPKALLARLNQVKLQLGELGGGPNNLPERQQTMHNTLLWSYDLLSEPEKSAFERLGIFVGGWSLEAAAWMLAGQAEAGGARPLNNSGDLMDSALQILENLLDKSMLRQFEDTEGQLRFSMLRVIREYALEKLVGRGQAALDATQHKHLVFYLRLAEEAEAKLGSDEQTTWLARLEIEHSNMRESLRWALEQNKPGDITGADEVKKQYLDEVGLMGLRLVCKLEFFWLVRGYLSEGRGWLEAFLNLAQLKEQTQTEDYGAALYHASRLARAQGDYARALRYDEASLAVFEKLGNQSGIATVLDNLGNIARLRGDVDTARSYFEKSLAGFRELNDQYNVCRLLNSLGAIASDREDLAQAHRYCEASLAIARQAGIKRMLALILNNLGNLDHKQENLDGARAYYQESLTLKRELGDNKSIAVTLNNLGLVLASQGILDRAKELLEESLMLRKVLGDKHGLGHTYHSLSEVALAQKDWVGTAQVLEQSLLLRYELNHRPGIIECLVNFAILAINLGQPGRAAGIFSLVEKLLEQHNIKLNVYDKAKYEQGRTVIATMAGLNKVVLTGNEPDGQNLALTDILRLVGVYSN